VRDQTNDDVVYATWAWNNFVDYTIGNFLHDASVSVKKVNHWM